MAEPTPALPPLEARHPLAYLAAEIGRSTLRVVVTKELLAIDYAAWMQQQLTAALGPLPEPGRSVDYGSRQSLLWSGVGQLMSYAHETTIGEAALSEKIATAGYVTDVSDGWIALELEGPDAQARLDLITMPDLSTDNFGVGAVTSTVLNHIRVLIWRQASERLVLLSAASSAESFLHSLRAGLEQAPLR